MIGTIGHESARDPRRVPLEAGFNLRDFGGDPVGAGRRVRLGMLYRSGTMALLSDADEAALRSLGICSICDFRRPNERAAEPTRWHLDTAVDYWARDYEEVSGVLGEILKRPDRSADAMRAAMTRLYRTILHDHAPSFARMVQRLADGGAPLLINCSAGKDRTGVGAALLLTLLGVSREDVERDYLATNRHADWALLFRRRANTLVARTARADPETVAPLMRAEQVYLETMFDELDTVWGGAEGYFAHAGIDGATIKRMRGQLIEPV